MSSFVSIREQIRRRIEHRIDSLEKGYRQNVGIIGVSGMGKTALLASLYANRSIQTRFVVIYINGETVDFDHLAQRWIESLLAGVATLRCLDLSMDLSERLKICHDFMPKTVERIRAFRKTLKRGERNDDTVRELFGLTEQLSDEIGHKILLMLDEFHFFEKLPAQDPFALLGNQMMIEKNTCYLVTSSKLMKAREIFQDKLALLFGNFEVMEIPPFDSREAAEFIERKLPGALFEEAQKKFLILMSSGRPDYLEYYLDHIVERNTDASNELPAGRDRLSWKVKTEHVLDAVYRELLHEKGRISKRFESRLHDCRFFAKDASAHIKALTAISEGCSKAHPIAVYLDKKSREVKSILQRLIQEEILIKEGFFYRFEDDVFAFWIREFFQRMNRNYQPSRDAIYQELKDLCAREYEKMQSTNGQEVAVRVEKLFKSFHNDLIPVGERKIKFPLFNEVVVRPMPGGQSYTVMARTSSGIKWACHIACHKVLEEDVALFAEIPSKPKTKIHKRIFIALSGIEQNAKLMLQASGILFFDLNGFNQLLRLYHLPKMIWTKRTDGSTFSELAQTMHLYR